MNTKEMRWKVRFLFSSILTWGSPSEWMRQSPAEPQTSGGRVCSESAEDTECMSAWASCRCPRVRGQRCRTHTVHLQAPKCFCTKVSHSVGTTRPPTGWSKKEALPSTCSSSSHTVTAKLAFSLKAAVQRRTKTIWSWCRKIKTLNNDDEQED